KRSLDDVMRALWEICKDDRPGFREDEIRQQYVRFGGSREFFDEIVMDPGQMPLEEQLAKVGYRLSADQVAYVDNGFDARPAFGSGQVRIRNVRDSAASSGLKVGDTLLEVNGESVQGANFRETFGKVRAALAGAEVGTAIRLKVSRDGAEHEFSVVPVEAFRSEWKVEDVANGDARKISFRKAWITGR
ncbi:MAG: PDZ domain-containing protein, partial [Armatimonadetes bacterium]|nr:PDZ domain-containing protein [Armatimonadota bacterium]